MKDIIVKRERRKVDYAKIIRCLGLQDDYLDYFYYTHPRLISARRQARYFLQYKKVDIITVDIFLSQNKDIFDYSSLLIALKGDLSQCYLR